MEFESNMFYNIFLQHILKTFTVFSLFKKQIIKVAAQERANTVSNLITLFNHIIMNKIVKKTADLFRTVNHCLASAEVYLSMTSHK